MENFKAGSYTFIDMKDYKEVASVNTRVEAEIINGYLKANGIVNSVITGDEGGAYPYPSSATTTGVKVMVPKKVYKQAVELLKKVK